MPPGVAGDGLPQVGWMNPCPCVYHGDPRRACSCAAGLLSDIANKRTDSRQAPCVHREYGCQRSLLPSMSVRRNVTVPEGGSGMDPFLDDIHY